MLKIGSKNRAIYKPPPVQDYSSNYCKLIIVILISVVFIGGQFIGGYISGSIAVISDAIHLVTDLIGFIVSFVFIYFSRKQPTEQMSFGFHRMQLIGALGNLFIIWTLALFMLVEATHRIIDKQFVKQPLAMLIIGVGGLIINIIMFFVLHSGDHSHGAMAQKCNHDHYQNRQDHLQYDTSFCNQMICQDQICLNQVNQPHCHKKDQMGSPKIHYHENQRKKSSDPIQQDNHQNNQNQQQTINNLNSNKIKQNQQHKHGQNCKHQHNNSKISNKNSKIANQHQHQHKDGHKCNGNHDHHKHKHNNQHRHNDHEGHDHNHEGHDHHHEGHDHNPHQSHDHNNHQIHESLGMKAAVLHALSDVIQSIGLLISSLIIFFVGSNKGAHVTEWNDWHYLDPISTYIFSIIVICSTFPIVKNCYSLIMQSTPSLQKARSIKKQFQQTKGVIDVHDIHIWDLRPGKTLIIAHVLARQGTQRDVLTRLTQICRHKKIYHSTLQIQQQNWKNHQQYILCDHNIH